MQLLQNLKTVFGDITQIPADTIINAANTTLKHGGGVAKVIVSAGGKIIQEESDKIGFCPIGKAVATSAGRLPAKFVIHVPTIDYEKNYRASFEDIAAGFRAALFLARGKKLEKVTTPLLGAGVVGLDPQKVEETLSNVTCEFPDLEVFLVVRK